MKRHRFTQTTSLEDRIREQGKRVRDEANKLPPGKERDRLSKKGRDADAGEKMNQWLTSPDLRPPH
jgi:hypothetical protein